MMKRSCRFPYEVRDKTTLDFEGRCFLEGYALACADFMRRLSGDSPCDKSYDPLTIDGNTLHSYAFDFKDGGRHHDATLYENVGEIMEAMLDESIEWIRDEVSNGS